MIYNAKNSYFGLTVQELIDVLMQVPDKSITVNYGIAYMEEENGDPGRFQEVRVYNDAVILE